VAVSLGKKGFIENLKKNQFSGVGRTVRALGADGPRDFDIYLISEIFAKVSKKMRFQADSPQTPGGQSIILNRTGCILVDRADGRRPARGQSAGPRRTVRPTQRSVLPAVDFAFLPLEFKRGQSARYAFFP
jgi:hypothetical protein